MARPAKVWYRSDIGWWMITLGGEKIRLVQGPNDVYHRQLAEEKYVDADGRAKAWREEGRTAE